MGGASGGYTDQYKAFDDEGSQIHWSTILLHLQVHFVLGIDIPFCFIEILEISTRRRIRIVLESVGVVLLPVSHGSTSVAEITLGAFVRE